MKKNIILSTIVLLSGTSFAQVTPFTPSSRPGLPIGIPIPGGNGPVQSIAPSGVRPLPLTQQNMSNLPVGYSQAEADKNIPIASLRPEHPKTIDLPRSSESVEMTEKGVNQVLDKAQDQSFQRLNKMSLNDVGHEGGATSSLPAPNLSGYKNELDDLSATQRKIRLLEAKQKEADLVVKLWSTLYDPKKESVDPKLKNVATLTPGTMQNFPENPPETVPSYNQPIKNSDLKNKLGDTSNSSVKDKKKEKEKMNLPKIVSLSGSVDNIVATLLIPYVGEKDMTVGDDLPHGRKIISISEKNGVIISDPKKGKISLEYGTSVPGGEE